jgi:hypothetical protein
MAFVTTSATIVFYQKTIRLTREVVAAMDSQEKLNDLIEIYNRCTGKELTYDGIIFPVKESRQDLIKNFSRILGLMDAF